MFMQKVKIIGHGLRGQNNFNSVCFTDGYEMLQKSWSDTKEISYCFLFVCLFLLMLFFKIMRHILMLHGGKYCQVWLKLSDSGLQLQFEFTDGLEMMGKVRSDIEEKRCLLLRRHPLNLKVTRA